MKPCGSTEPGGDSGKSSNKTLALVAFGVGGAGLVVGSITGLIALGKSGDLKDACGPNKDTCPSTAQSDIDSYKTMGTISTVGFIVAGVGGAAGLILLLTSPKTSTGNAGTSRYATVPVPVKRETGLSMTPYFGGTSAGVSGHF